MVSFSWILQDKCGENTYFTKIKVFFHQNVTFELKIQSQLRLNFEAEF